MILTESLVTRILLQRLLRNSGNLSERVYSLFDVFVYYFPFHKSIFRMICLQSIDVFNFKVSVIFLILVFVH